MNLAALIDDHPGSAPSLVTADGGITTYGGLRVAAAAMQDRLAAQGIAPGDRVAIISGNHPAFVIAYLGALRAGAVAVPLNPASPPAELRRQLDAVDAAAVLIGPGSAASVDGIDPPLTVPVLVADSLSPDGMSPDGPSPDGRSPRAERDADDLAAMLFTAGTAGTPRPAMLTHGNLLSNLDQIQRHPGRAVEPGDVVLGVLPMSHIFGLNPVLGGALLVGASVLLLDRFDPVVTLELVARHQVTILVGAPTLYAALAAAAAAAPDPVRLPSVRLAFCGAAPLPAEVASAWERRFGLPLRQGYGLTEASPVVTSSVMDRPARATSIGVPIPGVEVRLVDDEGEEALAGDPGEIWVRGPNVFSGYWQDPAATAAALTADGWLRTGDMAVLGDDGQLSIVDRAKDLIIVSGFNVYPAEVENVLAEHPDVAEVAVVGDADPYRGEAVHAFVVAEPGHQTTEPALIAWCGHRLARYKCPTKVTVVPELPHGLAGKLLRRALRAGPVPGLPGLPGVPGRRGPAEG